jgi:hypothetical protein
MHAKDNQMIMDEETNLKRAFVENICHESEL